MSSEHMSEYVTELLERLIEATRNQTETLKAIHTTLKMIELLAMEPKN